MRILIDTNVLISAILFPNPNMNQLMDRIALEYTRAFHGADKQVGVNRGF